jgi:hypothetical protein
MKSDEGQISLGLSHSPTSQHQASWKEILQQHGQIQNGGVETQKGSQDPVYELSSFVAHEDDSKGEEGEA